MIRDLSELEIRQLLQNKHYAHLACCNEVSQPYLVPITYVFKDDKLYAYSYVGKKIEIMRDQPNVCVQVEDMISDTAWQSAMIWGTYRELEGKEREEAFTLLIEKFWKNYNEKISIYFPFRNPDRDLNEKNIVLFAIDIAKQSGRAENYDK